MQVIRINDDIDKSPTPCYGCSAHDTDSILLCYRCRARVDMFIKRGISLLPVVAGPLMNHYQAEVQ